MNISTSRIAGASIISKSRYHCVPRTLYNSNTEYTPIKADSVDRILLQLPRIQEYDENHVFFWAATNVRIQNTEIKTLYTREGAM